MTVQEFSTLEKGDALVIGEETFIFVNRHCGGFATFTRQSDEAECILRLAGDTITILNLGKSIPSDKITVTKTTAVKVDA